MENRYSDADLVEFKTLIEAKLEKTKTQINDLEEQLKEANESSEDDFGTDMIDDSSFGSQIEFLGDMLVRQKKHATSLENALKRIENKTYGICVVTGELIDKRRLMAVPTTTKSLQAKTASRTVESKKEKPEKHKSSKKAEPKIITKVVKKSKPKNPNEIPIDEEDDDLFGDTEELKEEIDNEEFDFDQIADED
ncbi:MAG: TraR/DksA C4-type zinc finger protein [Bacteroidota bacterium]